MTQLVEPNLSVVGYPDYCLAYVEQVFGVTNDPDPDAWTGWNNTKYKHGDTPPADVCVPIWFSWVGTIDGETKNWGHVAVWVRGEVYTNPLSGSGHKVFPSITALESNYGVQYVGWSEDISTLKVVEEENMAEPTDLGVSRVQAYFIGGRNGFDGRPNALIGESDEDLNANHVGHDARDENGNWYGSKESHDWVATLAGVYAERDHLRQQVKDLQANGSSPLPAPIPTPAPKPTPVKKHWWQFWLN